MINSVHTPQLEGNMYSLLAKWTLKHGKEKPAITALKRLAQEVQQHEEETLIYLVHLPDLVEESLPTPSNLEVVFFEVYRNKAAFLAHVNGPIFTKFVNKHIDLFLTTTSKGKEGESIVSPFVQVEFLKQKAGFIRQEAIEL
jgi:quinol monooxygenase YgiN